MVLTYIIFPLLIAFAVYLLGHIPFVSGFYKLVIVDFLGTILHTIDVFVAQLCYSDIEETRNIGLRIILILVALLFALLSLIAEIAGSMQALPALMGSAFATFTLPPIVNSSLAVLFVSMSCLWGIVLCEIKGLVPDGARIFLIPIKAERWFNRFITVGFWVSVVATVLYYGLKISYLANSESNLTTLLRIATTILIGLLVPLTCLLALLLLAVGIQAILMLALTPPWLLLHLLALMCEKMGSHYAAIETQRKEQKKPSQQLAVRGYSWGQGQNTGYTVASSPYQQPPPSPLISQQPAPLAISDRITDPNLPIVTDSGNQQSKKA